MRIISGQAGGRTIKVPASVARPTTDRVREAVFSSLGDLVPGAHVLDLYAGSGALGLECLSRGAESVVFVDQSKESVDTIRKNLTATGLDVPNKSRIVRGAVITQLRSLLSQGTYDLIFADPPYALDDETTAELGNLLKSRELEQSIVEQNATLILESWEKRPIPALKSSLALLREKAYGKTRVSYIGAA